MIAFEHANAKTVDDALEALGPDTRLMAGGIDLLQLMKSGIETPGRLVNLKTAPELRGVTPTAAGVRVGALTTLSELARHEAIGSRPSLGGLHQALVRTASPQIRHMATIGGNLLQKPRCWYFRNKLTHCWLKGGQRCYAVRAENKYHAVFGRRACQAVHPSDPAIALAALQAEVTLAAADGTRVLPIEDLFQVPERDARAQLTLGAAEILTHIFVPRQPSTCRTAFVKVAERSAWDFALVSAAVLLDRENGVVRGVRVILGGVAPMPWRVAGAEDALLDETLDEDVINRAAEVAAADARPLDKNAYKVTIIRGAVRQALRDLA